jgi:nitric oxide dioxygenase
MNPTQVDLIRTSWSQVAPIQDQAAELFYGRLFELNPGLAPLFSHTDMAKQGKVLMQTLTVVVKSLDRLETIVPAVEALGRRHAGYGVVPEDFDTVGEALLWTLAQGLGDGFSADHRDAWAAAYSTLASVMIAASSEEAAATREVAAA